MTTKEKQGFGLYFLLAFGLAWLCQVGGCMALLQKQNAVLYQLALVATMLCPLLAVLLVQKVFLRQPTGIGWKVQGKRRYWLAAWFGPAVFTVLAAVLYFAVFPHRLDLSGSWLAAAYGGEMDAQTLRRELGVSNLSYMLETGLFAVTLAPVINMFAALGEEAGWRGYMMPHLKAQLGLLNGRLLAGKSTVISTNLDPEELGRRSGAPLLSRLEGEYQLLPFVGTDIRRLKRERGYALDLPSCLRIGQTAKGRHHMMPALWLR